MFVEKKVKDVISSYVDLIMKLICNCVNRRGQKKEQEGDALDGREMRRKRKKN